MAGPAATPPADASRVNREAHSGRLGSSSRRAAELAPVARATATPCRARAGREREQAVRGGEDEAAGQAHQHRQHQCGAAADVVGPVTGQDRRGHERQDVGRERHRDVERGDPEFGLQQRVQRGGEIRADQQREDHDAGHHQPCGGGSVPAPAVSCGRAHAEFAEDCHVRALAWKRAACFPVVGESPARRRFDTYTMQHC